MGTVYDYKQKIEIAGIPSCPIPRGMKLGEPAYTLRRTKPNDRIVGRDGVWRDTSHRSKEYYIVANFVPDVPEEPEFVDVEKVLLDGIWKIEAPKGNAATHRFLPLSDAVSFPEFVCYVWKTEQDATVYKSYHHCLNEYGVICTHVKFRVK